MFTNELPWKKDRKQKKFKVSKTREKKVRKTLSPQKKTNKTKKQNKKQKKNMAVSASHELSLLRCVYLWAALKKRQKTKNIQSFEDQRKKVHKTLSPQKKKTKQNKNKKQNKKYDG